jgi:hypothetical protein
VDCRSVPTRGGKNLAKFGGRQFQLLLLSLFTVLFGVEVGASGNRVGRLLIYNMLMVGQDVVKT